MEHTTIEYVVEMGKVGMLIALGLMSVMLMPIVGVAASFGGGSGFKCPNAFFTFGDSLSDTGNSQTSFPTASRLYPPYGISYTFHDKPGFNRYSDGRLIVDFVGTPPFTCMSAMNPYVARDGGRISCM